MQRGRFYIGIDWATEEHALCVMDAESRIINERKIPNDTTLFEVIVKLIGGAAPNEVFIAIESRRLVLVEALVGYGFKVFTINPKQSERFRDRFTVAGAKDDRFDARVLASALRTDTDLFRAVEMETEQQVRLRIATRMEGVLQAQFREAANRLRDVIMSSVPLLLSLCSGADEPWFWELATLATSPEVARTLSDEAVVEVLKAHRIRRIKLSDVRSVLNSGHLSAAPGVCEGAEWQAKLIIDQLKLLKAQVKSCQIEVERFLHELSPAKDGLSDVQIILSAPGFAAHCTAVLLAEAGPQVARRSYAELRSVCGVAPVTKSSGKKRTRSKWQRGNAPANGVVVMRQAANMRLRDAMHHAGTAAIRDPRFKPIYARLRAAGANHARAIRGVGDRLLHVIVGMLRSRTLYRQLECPAASKANP
jgi:transposase